MNLAVYITTTQVKLAIGLYTNQQGDGSVEQVRMIANGEVTDLVYDAIRSKIVELGGMPNTMTAGIKMGARILLNELSQV